MSANEIEKKDRIYFFIVKEFTKFILVGIFLIFISKFIEGIFVFYYGIEEYLKKDILRLFVDSHFVGYAHNYINKIDEYFSYVSHTAYNKYLWIIPYSMSMIHLYISYYVAHKIVDRSGIGATKRLNFVYFFFIYGISNALARIDIFSYLLIFWWYIFYKIIKIGVLKIEEKLKK